jgi:hypothetical protein
MRCQDIKITVFEPDTHDEIIERYTNAVLWVIKERVPLELLDTFIEKLKGAI